VHSGKRGKTDKTRQRRSTCPERIQGKRNRVHRERNVRVLRNHAWDVFGSQIDGVKGKKWTEKGGKRKNPKRACHLVSLHPIGKGARYDTEGMEKGLTAESSGRASQLRISWTGVHRLRYNNNEPWGGQKGLLESGKGAGLIPRRRHRPTRRGKILYIHNASTASRGRHTHPTHQEAEWFASGPLERGRGPDLVDKMKTK